ncbi:3-oxoacyl-ACP synthase [Archangium violaceum]|uniref:3-oxoacyl-ACP synthase n=1 Tax=Archangium violaceum TaxID=83451 RepID=UPI00193B1801|nr:3-oxoacyl-ACP synthase [Archangium violaceum]QRK12467.1 3-oxoacyl-ACP synthase [Archangium violaceum]
MTPHQEGLAILALGLCTPLGLTARTTQVEMAAGTTRFFLTDVYKGTAEPARASVLTLLDCSLSRTERMASMAATALHDCLQGIRSNLGRLPLLLALPEPGRGATVSSELFLKLLQDSTPIRLEVAADNMLYKGRAGFFLALARAAKMLESQRVSCVLVGAVDSWCDTTSLRYLANVGRLPGRSRRDGIIPGEGAGFILVAQTTAMIGKGARPHGWVAAHAQAEEPNHFLQEKPNLADGLTEAFRQLRIHPRMGTRRVDEILSCQTGENFWAHEFDMAYLRNAALMPEPLAASLVAETLGDAGASAGVLGLGYALFRLSRTNPAQGQTPRILVYGCSDGGLVGACVVEGTR